MFQYILDRSLDPDFARARLARAVARRVARVHDPLVRYSLNGRALALPLSHDLPWNIRVHPTYSDNLRRLAAFVRQREGHLHLIDVGANVGDSWALAQPKLPADRAGDTFLLIEGSPRYFALLERNTRDVPGVTCVCRLISDTLGATDASIVLDEGNARVLTGGAHAERLEFDTLDHLLETQVSARAANLVKVDVEGADPKVLRGARGLIARARPVLMFEHSPRELVASGQSDRAIFDELAEWGYPRVLLYDHRGLLLAEASTSEVAPLDGFLRYARMQPAFYYDVCAFPGHTDAYAEFVRSEQAFYATLES